MTTNDPYTPDGPSSGDQQPEQPQQAWSQESPAAPSVAEQAQRSYGASGSQSYTPPQYSQSANEQDASDQTGGGQTQYDQGYGQPPYSAQPDYGQGASGQGYGEAGYGRPDYGQPYYAAQQPVYDQYGRPVYATPPKSMVVAILLAFFLGTLGIHNFYLGYTQKGIIQLVLTLVGYATAVLLVGFLAIFGVWVWMIVDLIQIACRSGQYTTDAQGVPLQ